MSAALETLSGTLRIFLFAVFIGVVAVGVLFLGFFAFLLVFPPCGGSTNYGALTIIVPVGLVGGILLWKFVRFGGRCLLGPSTQGASLVSNEHKALITYIQESEACGLPKKEIIERLSAQGWSKTQIAKAYRVQ